VNQGFVQSFEGGSAVGDVVVEKIGPDHIQHKHLAGAHYEDITVTAGTGMGKDFYELLKSMLEGKHIRKDMTFKRVDASQNVISQLDVVHAVVTEVAFPELDGAAKGVGQLTVRFSPEFTRKKRGSGKVSLRAAKPRQWMVSNFRLTIPGLDCTRVSKIGALSVTVPASSNTVGEQRDYEKEVSGLNVPNLVVTLGEQFAQSFIDWHESFVIEGRNDQSKEKEGTLEFLGADMKEVLFTLKFRGLGIFRLTGDNFDARSEAIRTLTAEMYCEGMEFGYGPGVVGG
jgi:hypothetical protein